MEMLTLQSCVLEAALLSRYLLESKGCLKHFFS